MRKRQLNEEVIFVEGGTVAVERQEIELLKRKAEVTQRKRIRLCAHQHVDEKLHEMFIVHTRDTYVRPHKHLNKIESFHVIEGSVDLIMFDEAGTITEILQMGDYQSGRPFYHRLSDPCYHTLLITSDVLVFHETTGGPFRSSDNIFAPWAPDGSDDARATEYMEALAKAGRQI